MEMEYHNIDCIMLSAVYVMETGMSAGIHCHIIEIVIRDQDIGGRTGDATSNASKTAKNLGASLHDDALFVWKRRRVLVLR